MFFADTNFDWPRIPSSPCKGSGNLTNIGHYFVLHFEGQSHGRNQQTEISLLIDGYACHKVRY